MCVSNNVVITAPTAHGSERASKVHVYIPVAQSSDLCHGVAQMSIICISEKGGCHLRLSI